MSETANKFNPIKAIEFKTQNKQALGLRTPDETDRSPLKNPDLMEPNMPEAGRNTPRGPGRNAAKESGMGRGFITTEHEGPGSRGAEDRANLEDVGSGPDVAAAKRFDRAEFDRYKAAGFSDEAAARACGY